MRLYSVMANTNKFEDDTTNPINESMKEQKQNNLTEYKRTNKRLSEKRS